MKYSVLKDIYFQTFLHFILKRVWLRAKLTGVSLWLEGRIYNPVVKAFLSRYYPKDMVLHLFVSNKISFLLCNSNHFTLILVHAFTRLKASQVLEGWNCFCFHQFFQDLYFELQTYVRGSMSTDFIVVSSLLHAHTNLCTDRCFWPKSPFCV